MVIFEKPHDHRLPYKINIYDLNLNVPKIAVTETEIFIQDWETMRILDFRSFNVFQNEASFVTLSLPWGGVWRRKGVDEETLEPVHHMEVYRKVLKYLHGLSVNCQTVIKCYPIVDPEIESFNLSDDFIGYRQRNSEMAEILKKMESKTVQISKNMEVSVMGDIIQCGNWRHS